jgi:hypothetical protein
MEKLAIVVEAGGLRASGTSLRRVSELLADAGHFNRLGKPFTPVRIERMLTAMKACVAQEGRAAKTLA